MSTDPHAKTEADRKVAEIREKIRELQRAEGNLKRLLSLLSTYKDEDLPDSVIEEKDRISKIREYDFHKESP